MSVHSCSICSSPVSLWTKKNGYEIYACSKCGYGQVLPHLTIDDIHNLYKMSGHDTDLVKKGPLDLDKIYAEENEYPNSTVDADRIVHKALSYQELGYKKVLDIGAGYGFFSAAFKKNGYEVDAIELAANEREIFEKMNGSVPYNTTFEEFTSNSLYSNILMSQILEHVIDPQNWMVTANKLLSPKGVLIIAVPNFGSIFKKIMGSKEPFIIPPYHLNYFTKQSLAILLERNGFELISATTHSRLPFKKIFSRAPTVLAPILSGTGKLLLSAIDLFKTGAIINVYARKK